MLQLTFNPRLMLTGFRTTQPRLQCLKSDILSYKFLSEKDSSAVLNNFIFEVSLHLLCCMWSCEQFNPCNLYFNI